MGLSPNALDQIKKDLDDLVKRANERGMKAARLQGQHDIIKRILLPLGLESVATIELARVNQELEVLTKERDECNLQLETITTMVNEHTTSKEQKNDNQSTEAGTDEGTGTSSKD
jgi:hypothetical protein